MADAPVEDPIGPLLSRANLARVRGNIEEGITLCKSALEQAPASVEAHALLGDLHAAKGQEDEALHYYSLAVDLKPDSAPLREKRDKLVQAKHARLVAAQKAAVPQVQVQAEKPRAPAIQKPRPRWLLAALVAGGGVLVLLLGIWLGTVLSNGNKTLVPTKEPGTVGRR